MALTEFQRTICRLIAANRIEHGESYVAGGVALNVVTGGSRISRDIDLFHDTEEALDATWHADRELLQANDVDVHVVRERPSFVEATVRRGAESVLMQWVRDSAYRFFPLMTHEEFGLTLHPFDLATNKALALVGRLEVRDWVDLMNCHDRVQPLGYLAWAACGKDPGYNPAMILEHAARSGRYSAEDVAELSFDGPPPDAAALARQWHTMLDRAKQIVGCLPVEEVGKCVLTSRGDLYSGSPEQLREDLAGSGLAYHSGCIRGAYPQIVG